MVLDLDRLLDFPFWTRFGFTLSTELLFFFLAGFGFGRASGFRFLDMIRDHVEPRPFVFCFLWIDLDRSLASVCGFSVRQGSTPWRVWRAGLVWGVLPHVRRVMSSLCVLWPLGIALRPWDRLKYKKKKKRVVKGLIKHGLGVD